MVLPFLKPNKTPSDASPCCPSFVFNLNEISGTPIIKSFRWYVGSKGLLAESNGFRKSKSSMDCFGILISDIRLFFSNNPSTTAVFLGVIQHMIIRCYQFYKIN